MYRMFVAYFMLMFFANYKCEDWGPMLCCLMFALIYTLILVWPDYEETKENVRYFRTEFRGLFLWPEAGSSADLRRRVKELKRQVAEDKKILTRVSKTK